MGHPAITTEVAHWEAGWQALDNSNHEYVATRYWVQSLQLTYQVKVWDRHQETYVDHEITEHFTDLDLESHAAS